MTAPKPPPRTLQPAEERKIQLFLERAAPIVLENPHLTAERWQVLAAMANELDLTADQLRSTIDDLLNRGVLKGLAVKPPKPPPLPGKTASPSGATRTDSNSEDFALSPPLPPPVQTSPDLNLDLPTLTGPVAKPPSVVEPNEAVGRQATGLPLPAFPPPALAAETVKSTRERFVEQATMILAEQRGLNAKSQAQLASAAQKLGLNEAEAREALHALVQPPDATSSEPPITTEKPGATRWRVEGAPAPIPPPPEKTPSQFFLEFARPSLAAVRDGIIPVELEQRLIAHGTRVLGLSPVYARHLLLDLVAERKLKLASAAEASPVPELPAVATDPRWAQLLQVAKPILAQHRGWNAQSRVLINALGREQGLSEQEVEQAVVSLTTRETDQPLDRYQQERLASFLGHVELSLKKAARGILTPPLHEKLLTAGVELFGLQTELATNAIREITEKLKLAVVTIEQAERHVTELLQDVPIDGAELTRRQRDRIELEGAQWGLHSSRVKQLIDEHQRQNARKAHAEERLTRWALSAAVLAIVLVLGFIIWAATNSRRPAPATVVDASSPEPPRLPEPDREPSWLDLNSNLAIAVINARTDFPALRKSLIDLSANDPARRNTAYDTVTSHFLGKITDDRRRRDLGEMLSLCIANDPADASAARLLNTLLGQVPGPSDDFPEKAESLAPMFWGVRVVASALSHAKGQDTRVSQIVAALHRAIGIAPDATLPIPELQQICLSSLSERLFRSLISASTDSLTNAAPMHAALVQEATNFLTAAQLDKFNAEFLASRLTKEPAQWRNYEDLLRFTSASRETLAVLQLVELLEMTENSELREFLGQLLLMRTPGAPAGKSVEEIAAFVRQGLGVTDTFDPDGVWAKLSREARGVLGSGPVAPEPTTPALAEILKLAHYSTLGCAFAQNEWTNAAIVEIKKAGPLTPEAGLEPMPDAVAPDRSSPTAATLDRGKWEALRVPIATLARRTQPSERIAALESLIRLVDDIPDLTPEMAAVVAAYMLSNKSGAEHTRVLDALATLTKWNQLLIALADRLEDTTLTQEQFWSLMARILGAERKFAEGKEGRADARSEILRFIMRRLATAEPAISAVSVSVSENAARLLAENYATQARLLGTAIPESAVQSKDPHAVLRALVEEFAARLAAGKPSDGQREELAKIPHELTAVDSVSGSNDVQKLSAVQRIWLRLIALEAARRDEAKTGEARELLAALQQKDRQAKHVLSQLREGQAAELQMWLLIGRRG